MFCNVENNSVMLKIKIQIFFEQEANTVNSIKELELH